MEELFENLKSEFDAGFADRVMNRISYSSQSEQSRFLNRVQKISFSLAAASLLIFFGSQIVLNGKIESDKMIGLSEYSDFEISEMEYFNEE